MVDYDNNMMGVTIWIKLDGKNISSRAQGPQIQHF